MKILFVFLQIAVFFISGTFAQQYAWVNLTANLPDTNMFGGLGKVVFIGNHGWITQAWYGLPRKIFYTADGGQTFTTHYLPDDAGMIGDIFMRSETEGYIVTRWDSLGNTGKIFHTTDAQNGNWTLLNEVSGSGFYCIAFPPEPDPVGYLGSASGEIWKINGNNVTYDGWCYTNYDVTGLSFPVNSDEGWAVGGLSLQHRDSTGWVMADQNYSASGLAGVWFHDNKNGWICGDNQDILHTTDGHNWITQHSSNSKTLYGIDFCDLQNGWSAGIESILHTTDGGAHWISQSEGISRISDMELFGLCVTGPSTAYAVGMYRSTLRPVFLKYMEITGTEERPLPEMSVFPNPAKDKCKMQNVKCNPDEKCEVTLVDLFGRKVMSVFRGKMPSGGVGFDVGGLPEGVYLVKMLTGSSVAAVKLTVVR